MKRCGWNHHSVSVLRLLIEGTGDTSAIQLPIGVPNLFNTINFIYFVLGF